MSISRKIERILLTARGDDCVVYAIVACADGSFAVTRNGELDGDQRWSGEDMEKCAEAFIGTAGLEDLATRGSPGGQQKIE
jgi:hypothetical protein